MMEDDQSQARSQNKGMTSTVDVVQHFRYVEVNGSSSLAITHSMSYN